MSGQEKLSIGRKMGGFLSGAASIGSLVVALLGAGTL